MAPRRLFVALEAHVVDSRPGVWCPTCRAPVAVESLVAAADVASLAVIARQRIVECPGCGTSTVLA